MKGDNGDIRRLGDKNSLCTQCEMDKGSCIFLTVLLNPELGERYLVVQHLFSLLLELLGDLLLTFDCCY